MTTLNLISGTQFKFKPTGKIFTIGKVTETRISWYLGFICKGGFAKNNLRMTSTSIRIFQEGLDNGIYTIIKN